MLKNKINVEIRFERYLSFSRCYRDYLDSTFYFVPSRSRDFVFSSEYEIREVNGQNQKGVI